MKKYRLRSDILVLDRLLIQFPASFLRWIVYYGGKKEFSSVTKERPLFDIIIGIFMWIILKVILFF
ncbi:hypothetical protein R9C00_17080 [Flammeovirgaceae bacterium SG7u.111]|nr:hypothetical protein [Flammeovirgaceae bacterium SG7u.132]WPO33415.1 hypothetical protein R9C00_17080 [Flammeovirgaceae bacterium SG7u.111]